MVDKDYTYVPILGEEDKLAGMLSLRGLLEHKIDHLASELDAVTQYLSVDGPGGAAFRSEPVERRASPREVRANCERFRTPRH